MVTQAILSIQRTKKRPQRTPAANALPQPAVQGQKAPPVPAQKLPKPAPVHDQTEEELQFLLEEANPDVPTQGTNTDIETDGVALDPVRWATALTTAADVARLELFLRNTFATVLNHEKWRFVANDCITTLSALALFSISLPAANRTNPQFIRGCKVQIVRLLVYRKLRSGQHPAYVENFAAAADGDGSPSWIREAEQRAATAVKASIARPSTGRGGGGGGRGRGNNNNNRGQSSSN